MSKKDKISFAAPVITLLTAATLSSAAAQTLPTLSDARATITGTEVVISGQIGTGLSFGDSDALAFRSTDGDTYLVVFDAGRDARKKLDGCAFAMFGDGTPCRFEGNAEIAINGSSIQLIIFEASAIGEPGK